MYFRNFRKEGAWRGKGKSVLIILSLAINRLKCYRKGHLRSNSKRFLYNHTQSVLPSQIHSMLMFNLSFKPGNNSKKKSQPPGERTLQSILESKKIKVKI